MQQEVGNWLEDLGRGQNEEEEGKWEGRREEKREGGGKSNNGVLLFSPMYSTVDTTSSFLMKHVNSPGLMKITSS